MLVDPRRLAREKRHLQTAGSTPERVNAARLAPSESIDDTAIEPHASREHVQKQQSEGRVEW
jgi:type VI protein secretion system component VasF